MNSIINEVKRLDQIENPTKLEFPSDDNKFKEKIKSYCSLPLKIIHFSKLFPVEIILTSRF